MNSLMPATPTEQSVGAKMTSEMTTETVTEETKEKTSILSFFT